MVNCDTSWKSLQHDTEKSGHRVEIYVGVWFGLWLFGLVYGSLVWSLALWFGVWLFGLVCGSLVWSSNFVCVNENVYSVAWLALFCSAPIFFVVVYSASHAHIFRCCA